MPEFKNKKYKNSSKLCEAILNETGVACYQDQILVLNQKNVN